MGFRRFGRRGSRGESYPDVRKRIWIGAQQLGWRDAKNNINRPMKAPTTSPSQPDPPAPPGLEPGGKPGSAEDPRVPSEQLTHPTTETTHTTKVPGSGIQFGGPDPVTSPEPPGLPAKRVNLAQRI